MYVVPRKAMEFYNVSDNALRAWANSDKIKYIKTKGGHRRYYIENKPTSNNEPRKVIYARVSSKKQHEHLQNQIKFLSEKYPTYRVITDIASGINFRRKGLESLLDGVFKGTISEIVVAERDRLTRFGYELFEWICKQHNVKLICTGSSRTSDTNELSDDLMAIITVFSARYYGRRKYSKLSKAEILSNDESKDNDE
jgi:putative resolvase